MVEALKLVVTGGPCTGKTTLVDRLSEQGFHAVPEAARLLIAEEEEKHNINPHYEPILPWDDLQKFEHLALERQLELERQHSRGTVFLDRSLVDVVAYAELGGMDIYKLFPDFDQLVTNARYSRVFFLEQLPYTTDEARKEDPEQAKKIHDKLYEVYDRYGFDVVTIPVSSVEERVQQVLGELQHAPSREKEGKFRVDDISAIKQALKHYKVDYQGSCEQHDSIHDIYGVLEINEYLFRLRQEEAQYLLTLKGPNTSDSINDRFEWEINLPSELHRFLQDVLPERMSYTKTRETYVPLGDPQCKICLDQVEHLGSFVEIEAASENQILLWQKRLGISSKPIRQSYSSLLSQEEMYTSR